LMQGDKNVKPGARTSCERGNVKDCPCTSKSTLVYVSAFAITREGRGLLYCFLANLNGRMGNRSIVHNMNG